MRARGVDVCSARNDSRRATVAAARDRLVSANACFECALCLCDDLERRARFIDSFGVDMMRDRRRWRGARET
jgi:hypothetical protein